MGRLTAWTYLADQWATIPSVSEFQADLTGKCVIVTGANVGLGLETARHFACMNPARLIIACRDVQKANVAIESIRSLTGCCALEAWKLDLADFASIRAFADRFELEGGGTLDLLVENAGITTFKYDRTIDGWERTLQVNYLGTSLLALLLLPYLLRSPPSSIPRLVLVTSEGHYYFDSLCEAKSPSILHRLNDKQFCTDEVMTQRYCVSKLLVLFFTRALAKRLRRPPDGSLTVTCVTPGLCRTELCREYSGLFFVIKGIADFLLARSTEVGSRIIVWAALQGSGSELHGRYVTTCRVEEESDFALSNEGLEAESRIWNETIEILSNIDPRVMGLVDEHLQNY